MYSSVNGCRYCDLLKFKLVLRYAFDNFNKILDCVILHKRITLHDRVHTSRYHLFPNVSLTLAYNTNYCRFRHLLRQSTFNTVVVVRSEPASTSHFHINLSFMRKENENTFI